MPAKRLSTRRMMAQRSAAACDMMLVWAPLSTNAFTLCPFTCGAWPLLGYRGSVFRSPSRSSLVMMRLMGLSEDDCHGMRCIRSLSGKAHA